MANLAKEMTVKDLQPISVFLPDDEKWREEYIQARTYFSLQGLDVYWVEGIHAKKWGIQGRHIYLLDNRPAEQFYIGDNKVGTFLSWYLLYHICKVWNKPYYMILESDCNLLDGWREKLNQALQDVPADFDFLFVGSCCAEDKEPVHVKGNIFEYPYRGAEKWNYYPQCGHCYIIAHKAMQILIDTQRDVASPVDVSLIKHAFPKLKIYAVLPRLADQGRKTTIAN